MHAEERRARLNGASSQHHVETKSSFGRHVCAHDVVPVLGHERHVLCSTGRVEAQRQEAHAHLSSQRFHLTAITYTYISLWDDAFGRGL